MNTTEQLAAKHTTIVHGPHAGHVLRGNYKVSTNKRGQMIAHKWSRGANRFIRCDLAEALSS